MIGWPRASCDLHRAALYEFADRREVGPATRAALDHLDRCDACSAELTDVALAMVALRRLGADVARATPALEAWPRLRARVSSGREVAFRARASLAGLLLSAAVAGLVVFPATFPRPVAREAAEVWLDPAVLSAQLRADQAAEAAYLRTIPRSPSAATAVEATPRTGSPGPPLVPDRGLPIRKEVTPDVSRGRPQPAS